MQSQPAQQCVTAPLEVKKVIPIHKYDDTPSKFADAICPQCGTVLHGSYCGSCDKIH